MDSAVARAHQHAAGARRRPSERDAKGGFAPRGRGAREEPGRADDQAAPLLRRQGEATLGRGHARSALREHPSSGSGGRLWAVQRPRGRTMPSSTARAAAWVRSETPSFSRMLWTWFFMVLRLKHSCSEILRFVCPSASKRGTSTSRGVSDPRTSWAFGPEPSAPRPPIFREVGVSAALSPWPIICRSPTHFGPCLI